VADFAGDPTNGVAPLTVALTNLSSGATDCVWDFGDGQTSTNVNPVNHYTNAGAFSVTLAVAGPGGTSALTRTNYIVVIPAPPVADFAGDPTNGVAPLTVTFTNLSSGATDYAWDFGDGQTSTNASPVNTYTNTGTFSVTLTAVGPGGTNALTRTNYIVVTDIIPPPRLAVSPASLDFGLISTGVLAQASFVVSNAGVASLQGAALVDTPFTILSGTPFTLDQSVSTNLVIRFAPTSPGVFSNAVVFSSNGGSSTHPVTGRAVGTVALLSPGAVGADFLFSFDTVAGLAYVVQYKDDLNHTNWQVLQTVPGDGTTKTVTNSLSVVTQRFYRLSVE
jgi:PKD repeat protein